MGDKAVWDDDAAFGFKHPPLDERSRRLLAVLGEQVQFATPVCKNVFRITATDGLFTQYLPNLHIDERDMLAMHETDGFSLALKVDVQKPGVVLFKRLTDEQVADFLEQVAEFKRSN